MGEIELPPALAEAEARLNLARQKALTNAAAAREAEQRKNDLIMYLAHDLKTPLTSVIGYLTLLQDEPPDLHRAAGPVHRHRAAQGRALEDLINEFFDITRFSLTHLELEKQPTDLTRMLEQVASEFAPQFAEKDLRCELELPPRLAYDCDPDKLARVFDNLLRNAFHYSFPGSTVRITGQQEADTVVLTFTNEGRTIPAEKLERIFDQFFRLDSSRATRTGGAGLGLAIARKSLPSTAGRSGLPARTTGSPLPSACPCRRPPQEIRKIFAGKSQEVCRNVHRSAGSESDTIFPSGKALGAGKDMRWKDCGYWCCSADALQSMRCLCSPPTAC